MKKKITAAVTAAALVLSGVTDAHAQEEWEEFEPVPMHGADPLTLDDSDGDGLPDEWENSGVITMSGEVFPLHKWGADPQRPDIFLQLNWMAPKAGKSFAPSQEMLWELVDLFDDNGVNLHIDAGDISVNMSPDGDKLGGESIDYQRYYFPGGTGDGVVGLYNQLDEVLGERQPVFRSGVIGDQMYEGSYSSGLAFTGGPAFFVANNDHMRNEDDVRNSILHELGHTLGLTHYGPMGQSPRLGKNEVLPNYRSVMNYLYQFSVFDYSHSGFVATSDLPRDCMKTNLVCYTGDYEVPSDWDNIQIAVGGIGRSPLDVVPLEVLVEKEPDMKDSEILESGVIGGPDTDNVDAVDPPGESEAEVEASTETESPSTAPEPTLSPEKRVDEPEKRESPERAPVDTAKEDPASKQAEPEAEEDSREKVNQEPQRSDAQKQSTEDSKEPASNVWHIVGAVMAALAVLGLVAAAVSYWNAASFSIAVPWR